MICNADFPRCLRRTGTTAIFTIAEHSCLLSTLRDSRAVPTARGGGR